MEKELKKDEAKRHYAEHISNIESQARITSLET
jgi:hypothetical protein